MNEYLEDTCWLDRNLHDARCIRRLVGDFLGGGRVMMKGWGAVS